LTGLEIILAVVCVMQLLLLIAGGYYIFWLGTLVLKMEDALEESLDILDERYASIQTVLEIPLFADSPEIRQVHTDLRRSRDCILEIANALQASVVAEDQES
jgi:hypothetical protein